MTTVTRRRDHPVARVLVWVLGVLAAAATLWLLFLGIVVMSEWSTYVGHESSTALAILTVVGVVPAVLAWIAFAIAWLVARGRAHSSGGGSSSSGGGDS